MPEPMTIGVDIGGTKVAAGLVDARGEITHKSRVPIVATGTAEAAFACVKASIDEIFAAAPGAREAVAGIGICAPGPLDPFQGIILNPPNLPCWRNFPLAAETARAFGVPARVDNDANAAGLAEAIWGAGIGYTNVFFAIVGTGIGTGIVFDRKLYYGRTGCAAEGGHVTIDYQGPVCGCGKHGCIEAFASGPNIAKRARGKLVAGAKSKILALAGSVEAVRTEHVGEAFAAGDPVAEEVLVETAHFPDPSLFCQLGLEQVGKKGMIPKPGMMLVKRKQKQIGTFQVSQNGRVVFFQFVCNDRRTWSSNSRVPCRSHQEFT